MRARQQQRHGVRHRAIVLLFFDKLREIVEAVRVQQTQTREVALHTELFRRRGQQQYARHAFGQLFNRLIFAARRVFAPDQVMSFIHHQQIPLGVAQMLKALLVAAHKIQRADNQLFSIERVVGFMLGFGVTLVVKQREAQVEAAQHLHQPLVL